MLLMVIQALAWWGIGGFYHYTYGRWTPEHPVIRGPYRSVRQARGPTWMARVYDVRQAIRFHWCPPAGARPDPGIVSEKTSR